MLGCLAAGCWGLRAESRSRTEQRCPILPRIPASTIVHHHTAAHNRDIGTLPGVLPTLQPSHPLLPSSSASFLQPDDWQANNMLTTHLLYTALTTLNPQSTLITEYLADARKLNLTICSLVKIDMPLFELVSNVCFLSASAQNCSALQPFCQWLYLKAYCPWLRPK